MQCHVMMFITAEPAFLPYESLSGDPKGWEGGFCLCIRRTAEARKYEDYNCDSSSAASLPGAMRR